MVTWARVAKIAEECGEVVAAYIGVTGQNPRKGVAGSMDDVVDELLDVALTALAAVEHLTGHRGEALGLLNRKIVRTGIRAGVIT
ncbi:MazG-like family protein [Phycicoccus sp. HDW14]|uniref:MazG-like family protein n=1 Tax=Phycicoccus sp. HDW14 TaxID=2714941 RepID=UPI001F0DE063|nr:MazG-like family protein [Phycicoccus sp. HDW14]